MTSVTPKANDSQKWQDLWAVKILQTFSTTIGLSLPNLYQYNGLPVLYVGYCLLLCLLQTTIQAYSFLIKLSTYSKPIHTIVILDICTTSIVFVTAISSMLCTIFFKRTKILKLINTLKMLEQELQGRFQSTAEYHGKILMLQFLALMALYILITVSLFMLFIPALNRSATEMCVLVVNKLQIVQTSVLVMQIHFYSSNIRCLFQLLHSGMQDRLEFRNEVSLMYSMPDTTYFLRKYDLLCDVIDMVSEAFGHQIFFMVCTITVNIIHALNLVLKSLGKLQILKTYSTVVPAVFLLIEYTVFAIILSASCDKAVKEAKKTSLVSYRILIEYRWFPKTTQEKIIKEELMLLSEHISRRNIHFTALVFTLDYSLLFTIFGSVASYLVVLLQFK